jgi:hypothetical protein
MLRAAFADRGSELLGLCLVLGGLLAGLSIYFDRAGVVGRVVDDAASWSVGLTKLVLPVAMVLLGFAMFRERYEFGEITKRMPVGGVLCLAGLTGLFHLGRDTPGIDDGADALGDEPIWHDGEVVGWVTSGGYAHWSEASCALGYLPSALAEADAPSGGFEVEVLGVRRTATRLDEPLFDPSGWRMRS